MLQTARFYAEHKAEWVRDMGTLRPDMQPEDLSELWDQFPSAWAVNGQLNIDTFQKTSDYLYATDDFAGVPRIPVTEWVDTGSSTRRSASSACTPASTIQEGHPPLMAKHGFFVIDSELHLEEPLDIFDNRIVGSRNPIAR